MSLRYRYGVDYWYRSADDTDRSVRTLPQMGAGANGLDDVRAEVAKLQAQGYTVQRAVMQDTCTMCDGAGRIGHAPKGTRKAKIAGLPNWRLRWVTCAACKGEGFISAMEVPING